MSCIYIDLPVQTHIFFLVFFFNRSSIKMPLTSLGASLDPGQNSTNKNNRDLLAYNARHPAISALRGVHIILTPLCIGCLCAESFGTFYVKTQDERSDKGQT